MPVRPLTIFFKDIDKNDLELAGGKGANLGEMVSAGFTVPNGFAITVYAYDLFLEQNGLSEKIYPLLKKTNVENPDELENTSRSIQRLIKSGELPEEIVKEVISSYKKLSGQSKGELVAVRSSATAEDLPKASFAGQQASFLNIKGEANLLNYIRDCWASLFTARSIFYRVENKIPHEKVKISVIVQKMVQSEVSGVMFTIDPVTNKKDNLVIEAVWGLGEMIVQGAVIPDKYVIQKETFYILSKEISDQRLQLIKVGSETNEVEVPKKVRELPKLSNEEIVKLAKVGELLQAHYYFPQDVEWAKEGKDIYIIQTRPITTMGEEKKIGEIEGEIKVLDTPLLKGSPASPGMATGPVRVLQSTREIEKVQKGDILVAPMTSPDFVPAMKRAAAIVTDKGGQTSHAAIVSRELGIPCVVGTNDATSKLKDEMIITVNGETGLIFLGSKIKREEKKEVHQKVLLTKTATKLYVNLGETDRVREIAKLNIDGVGLLRAEFMIANINVHPMEAIKKKEQDKFIDKLAHDLSIFCEAFGERPIVYRATDFKTNEYRALPGGKFWEPEEPNPMLGFRGAFRYIASPEAFNLELQAIKKVREKYKNLWLMIPFVRSPEELAKVRRLVAGEYLFESPTFKFWMMVELPINVILLEDFIKVGIDGVSVGSNDLTMLIQGTDRDNSDVSGAFDERSPAIFWCLKRVIKICNKHGITSSICGQAPSYYQDLVEKLVEMGITSISVNPDAINRVRGEIAEAEKKLATRHI